jgi:hypothetical protein
VPAEAGVFAVYDWGAAARGEGAWQLLPPGEELVRLAPGGSYVGPDGQVRVRVSAPEGRPLRFVIPEVTVEGTVAG